MTFIAKLAMTLADGNCSPEEEDGKGLAPEEKRKRPRAFRRQHCACVAALHSGALSQNGCGKLMMLLMPLSSSLLLSTPLSLPVVSSQRRAKRAVFSQGL